MSIRYYYSKILVTISLIHFSEVNPSSDECVFAICDIENSISIGYDTDPNKGFKLEGMFNLFLHQRMHVRECSEYRRTLSNLYCSGYLI